jgi:hypothetical protein
MNMEETMPQSVITAEKEWARILARNVASQLPQAVSKMRGLHLTPHQVNELQRVFENMLIANMGCEHHDKREAGDR